MTDQERDQIARDIYDTVTIHAGYTNTKSWVSLTDFEKHRWREAAKKAERRFAVIARVRIATGQAA